MTTWAWAAATCRGLSHERTGTRLQDAQCSRTLAGRSSRIFFSVVSDGAGSATFGGQGASLVCRSLVLSATAHYRECDALPTDGDVTSWIDIARDRILAVSARRSVAAREFAATVVCVLSSGIDTLVIHIGDGCAVLKDSTSGEWVAPIWPYHGEFASTTAFVTDDPAPRLSLARHCGPIGGIVLFSDGMERLALDFVSQKPFQQFFESMMPPLVMSGRDGYDRSLSVKLEAFLRSELVTSRTDDDKTLVLATLR